MSSVFQPFIDNLDNTKARIHDISKDIITQNSAEIVLLVKSQLSSGKNSYGKPLTWSGGSGYYAWATQKYYDNDNRKSSSAFQVPKTEGTPYNFTWTGETLDNLELGEVKQYVYEVTTVAYKQLLLESIYGEIFDLTDEHNDYINDTLLLPQLIERIFNEMVAGYI